ncbi:MAG: dienelactone hydrolase family protein [Pseudomonadota bacterium]
MMLEGPRVAPRSGTATALVVFLHGYGADGNDLIGLAEPLAAVLPGAAFASPNAPGTIAGGGRQWFPLTMRDPSEYARGVAAAAPALQAYLSAELLHHGLVDGALALVGFSQGTMMALHVAYRREAAIGAVVGFSGLCASAEPVRHPAPTLLVHGTADEVLPAGMTLQASQTLGEAGVSSQWHFITGLGHGIDGTGLGYAATHLSRALS